MKTTNEAFSVGDKVAFTSDLDVAGRNFNSALDSRLDRVKLNPR